MSPDRLDYAPGTRAVIVASGFQTGETVELLVLHNDGTSNTGGGHKPWQVIDGSANDLHGQANGSVQTTWFVNPDDSFKSSFNLTASGLTSGRLAKTTFTDSGSELNIAFSTTALTDAFTGLDGSAPDGGQWNVDTNIPQGSASVTIQSNQLELVNRGFLNTVSQFDPLTVGGVRITGTWTFDVTDTDYRQILTRGDGIPGRHGW
ncbi:MAG: hypothetical protein AAB676_03370 [Verrucomicrobiota bacterium]